MIRSFKQQGAADIFHGRDTKAARQTCPIQLWKVAVRKLDYLDAAAAQSDLLVPPGNRLEALQGDRAGQFSIRINQQYRICFRWSEGWVGDVEIVDYH